MLRPSVTKKLGHLAGIIFVVPMFVLGRWELLALFAAIIAGTWLLIRFTAYGLIGICILLLISADYRVVVAAWLVLIVGDGASGIAGLMWGSRRLPWNSAKSWAGLAGFVVSTLIALASFFILWGKVPWPAAAGGAALIALVSGLVESLPLKLNDNLTVVLAGGVLAWLFLLGER